MVVNYQPELSPAASRMLRDFFLGFIKIHVLHHTCYRITPLGEHTLTEARSKIAELIGEVSEA